MFPGGRPHAFPATRRLALVVVALLAAHAVAAWVALQATFVFVELAWRAIAAREDYRALLATHLGQFQILRAGQLALWLLTIAAFVGWVGRAQGNLVTLGATGFRYAPRQAMTAFLIPGVNLVRPLTVVRELWNASDPPRRPGRAGQAGAPQRVRWWWGLLLAAVSVEALARGLAVRSGRALDLGLAMQALVVGQLVSLAAAVVGIAVVLGIDSRQDAAAGRHPGRAGDA